MENITSIFTSPNDTGADTASISCGGGEQCDEVISTMTYA